MRQLQTFLMKRHPNCNKETLLPQLTEEMTNSSTGEKAPDEPEAPRHEEVFRRNSPVVGYLSGCRGIERAPNRQSWGDLTTKQSRNWVKTQRINK